MLMTGVVHFDLSKKRRVKLRQNKPSEDNEAEGPARYRMEHDERFHA